MSNTASGHHKQYPGVHKDNAVQYHLIWKQHVNRHCDRTASFERSHLIGQLVHLARG